VRRVEARSARSGSGSPVIASGSPLREDRHGELAQQLASAGADALPDRT
jgi:hypothetical protein